MADILVVEDEQLIARLLKETLQSEGYNVVTVLNGEDAVQFALCETPHLIILDLMLPGIDGYEVVRRLHMYPKTIHIPIIVLSSLGEPKDKVSAFETGVDDYITKPFSLAELVARGMTNREVAAALFLGERTVETHLSHGLHRTHDNRTPYAVDVTGGGRSSATSRRMSVNRFLGMATSAIWKAT